VLRHVTAAFYLLNFERWSKYKIPQIPQKPFAKNRNG